MIALIEFVNPCNYEFVPMSMCNNKFVIICFDSNSQTSEPIRNPKSSMVDLVGEDLEVEEQEGQRESKSLQIRTWIQVEKERLPQMFGLILQGRKLMENLKPNGIIVTNFTWVSLTKVQLICVII